MELDILVALNKLLKNPIPKASGTLRIESHKSNTNLSQIFSNTGHLLGGPTAG